MKPQISVASLHSLLKGPDSGLSFLPVGKLHFRKILCCLDCTEGVITYAVENDYDLVIVHHAIGEHYYQAYHGVARREEVVKAYGFDPDPLHDSIQKDLCRVRMGMRNANMVTILAVAKQIGITIASAHTVCDFLVWEYLAPLINREFYVTDLAKQLEEVVSHMECFPKSESVIAYSIVEATYKKPYFDIHTVGSPGVATLNGLRTQGCDLAIITAGIEFSEIPKGMSLLMLNHIPFDLLGLEIFSKQLYRKYHVDVNVFELSY